MILRNVLTATGAAAPMILGAAGLAFSASGAQAGVVGTLTYTGEVTVILGNGYDSSGTRVGDAFSLAIEFLNSGVADDNPDASLGSYIFGATDLAYTLAIGSNAEFGSAGRMSIVDEHLGILTQIGFSTLFGNGGGVYSNSNLNFNSAINGPDGFGIFSSDGLVDAIDDASPANFAAFGGDSASNAMQISRGGAQIHFSLDSLSYVPVPAPGAVGLLAVAGLAGIRRRR